MAHIHGHLFAASPQHWLIAAVSSPQSKPTLTIYDARGTVLSTPALPPSLAPIRSLSFHQSSQRLLVASDTSVLVVDALSAYRASVAHASSPAPRLARATLVTPHEVLAVADFGLKATVHDLSSGRSTEVQQPKPGRQAAAVRPGSAHVAVLAREAGGGKGGGGRDYVAVLAPDGGGGRAVEAGFALDSADAPGLRWSRSGAWLAAWEAPALGCRAWVYTADGHMFRAWSGGGDDGVRVGVKAAEWAGSDGADVLCLGLGDGTVVGLGGRTLAQVFALTFPASISLPAGTPVWHEQLVEAGAGGAHRRYAEAQQPAVPPGPPPSAPAAGVTHLAASPDGALVASVAASAPTTVWIHAVAPAATRAVLIHHAAVRAVAWNPAVARGRLLVVCAGLDGEPAAWVHAWDADAGPVAACADLPGGVSGAAWAGDGEVVAWSAAADGGAAVLALFGGGPLIRGDGPEDAFDEVQDDTFAFRRTDR